MQTIVYISKTLGAPSPTLIIFQQQLPVVQDCIDYIKSVYPILSDTGIAFSKVMFFAASGIPNHYVLRFFQMLQVESELFPKIEPGRDCLNSMVAVCDTILRLQQSALLEKREPIVLRNADTGLTISTLNNLSEGIISIEVRLPKPITPAEAVSPIAGNGKTFLALNVNNPYLLFDARQLDIAPAEMMKFEGPPSTDLLRYFDIGGRKYREYLGLPVDSDLPKIALLASDGQVIFARTIYLGVWHPGLPLTGIITFAIAAFLPNSPWYSDTRSLTEFRIQSPKETLQIGMSCQLMSGTITSFMIINRKVVNYVKNIFL